jgi:L-threonylcarbamoyladenylate synthase
MNKPSVILPTHTRAYFLAAVERAAALLRAGEVVVVPTETVYGLAANALDAQAVRRIFAIKGRPIHNPIIVHVASLEMARRCTTQWTELVQKLAAAFWPGPLTLVAPRSSEIPDIVTACGATVGVRWPSHPFIQTLIQACGFPLAAPSANRSGEISPTNAEHVHKSFGGTIPLIVDGGQAQIGIESTVVDMSVTPPCLLRPGMVDAESLRAIIGELTLGRASTEGSLRSPGLLPKHYAPKAKLVVWQWESEDHLHSQLSTLHSQFSAIHTIAHTHIPMDPKFGCVSVIPRDPVAYARAIYAELHRCDEAGAQLIIVEALPNHPEWSAIADRLKRASA